MVIRAPQKEGWLRRRPPALVEDGVVTIRRWLGVVRSWRTVGQCFGLGGGLEVRGWLSFTVVWGFLGNSRRGWRQLGQALVDVRIGEDGSPVLQ